MATSGVGSGRSPDRRKLVAGRYALANYGGTLSLLLLGRTPNQEAAHWVEAVEIPLDVETEREELVTLLSDEASCLSRDYFSSALVAPEGCSCHCL